MDPKFVLLVIFGVCCSRAQGSLKCYQCSDCEEITFRHLRYLRTCNDSTAINGQETSFNTTFSTGPGAYKQDAYYGSVEVRSKVNIVDILIPPNDKDSKNAEFRCYKRILEVNGQLRVDRGCVKYNGAINDTCEVVYAYLGSNDTITSDNATDCTLCLRDQCNGGHSVKSLYFAAVVAILFVTLQFNK